MSKAFLARPSRTLSRGSFAVVAGSYNAPYAQGLVEAALTELSTLVPEASITVHEVPGAFEIPLMVQLLAELPDIEAVIALGVIIQGETPHADIIARTVANTLQRIALETRKPVIHEVLLLENEEQAKKRCLDSASNRGTEAARTAVTMLQALQTVKRK